MAAFDSAAADNRCPAAPPGWTVEFRQGPDFHVCQFADPGKKGGFGLYSGFHPSFRPPAGAKGRRGRVDGIAVTWFKGPRGYETVFSTAAETCGRGPQVHMWAFADQATDLPEMMKAASSIRFPRHVPPPAQRYELAEMSLVATNPGNDPKVHWAEFRDPAGRRHRVLFGGRIGKSPGFLVGIDESSAKVEQILRDERCDFQHRHCVVTRTEVTCSGKP